MGGIDYPWAAEATREALALQTRMTDAAALADHFHIQLMEGGLNRVMDVVAARPETLAALLPIVANPEASMNVRLGASVIFERYAGSPALRALVSRLGELARHADARVRADACHFLGLTGTLEAEGYLGPCLNDPDAEVREIAAESLEAIRAHSP
jgi:HEAT repeat protein